MRTELASTAEGILRRLPFQECALTGMLVLTILIWYPIQHVLAAGWTLAQIRWVFTTASFPAFSPGLLLSVISHASWQHVGGNAAVLWFAGAASEQHMGAREFLAFFSAAGLASVLVGTAAGGSTMGASGAVFAFLSFYCLHRVLAHRDDFAIETLQQGSIPDLSVGTGQYLLLLSTPIALLLFYCGQAAGIFPVGRGDPVGHFVGVLCGLGYAVVRQHYRGALWSGC